MPLLGVENDTELRQSPSPPPPPLHEAPAVLSDGLDICAIARPPMKTIVTAKTARAFTVRRNPAERMAPPRRTLASRSVRTSGAGWPGTTRTVRFVKQKSNKSLLRTLDPPRTVCGKLLRPTRRSAVRPADEPEEAESQNGRRARLDHRTVERATHLHYANRGPDERHDPELAELDARVESEERRHEAHGRKPRLHQYRGESETVDETEQECDRPAQRLRTIDAAEQAEVAERKQRNPAECRGRHPPPPRRGGDREESERDGRRPWNHERSFAAQPDVLDGDERDREADERLDRRTIGMNPAEHRDAERQAVTDGEPRHQAGDAAEPPAEEQQGDQEGEVIGAAEDVLDPEPDVRADGRGSGGRERRAQEPARIALREDALRGPSSVTRDAREAHVARRDVGEERAADGEAARRRAPSPPFLSEPRRPRGERQ